MYKNKAIELLRGYDCICKQIEEVNQEIINYNQLIRSAGDSSNKSVEKIVDTYAVKIAEWENKLEELFRQKDEVENILDNLNFTERKIIELRYIKGLKWNQVAEQVNYSEKHCRRIGNKVFER